MSSCGKGFILCCLKGAIRPLLTKPALDLRVFINCRSISNLEFLAKVTENRRAFYYYYIVIHLKHLEWAREYGQDSLC